MNCDSCLRVFAWSLRLSFRDLGGHQTYFGRIFEILCQAKFSLVFYCFISFDVVLVYHSRKALEDSPRGRALALSPEP